MPTARRTFEFQFIDQEVFEFVGDTGVECDHISVALDDDISAADIGFAVPGLGETQTRKHGIQQICDFQVIGVLQVVESVPDRIVIGNIFDCIGNGSIRSRSYVVVIFQQFGDQLRGFEAAATDQILLCGVLDRMGKLNVDPARFQVVQPIATSWQTSPLRTMSRYKELK